MKISIIILTYNREQELRKVIQNVLAQSYKDIEIIIINNDISKKLKLNYPQTKCYDQKENLGVPAGRNLGASKATGDLFVFLDDDAFFVGKDNFQTILKKFEDPSIGALAFKVENFNYKQVIKAEFPHPDLSKQDEEFLVGRVVGCGHVFRKSIFEEGYDKNLKRFWHEELDLCYNIINKGYKILYCPDLFIIHKPATSGRLPSKEKYYNFIYNRVYIVVKHLPFIYCVPHLLAWSYMFFKQAWQTKFFKILFSAGYRGFVDGLKNRRVLNKQAIKYLKKAKGRLYY